MHCLQAVEAGASAAAAESLFIYRAKTQGVLINFPEQAIRNNLFRNMN